MTTNLIISSESYEDIKSIIHERILLTDYKFNVTEEWNIDIHALPVVCNNIIKEYLSMNITVIFDNRSSFDKIFTITDMWIDNVNIIFNINFWKIDVMRKDILLFNNINDSFAFSIIIDNPLLTSLLSKYFLINHYIYTIPLKGFWHTKQREYVHRVHTKQTEILRIIMYLYNIIMQICNKKMS